MKKYLNINLSVLVACVFVMASCTIDDSDTRAVEFTPKLGTANVAFLTAVTATSDTNVDVYADETLMVPGTTFGNFVDYMDYEYPQGTLFRAVIGGESPNYTSKGGANNNLATGTVADLLPATHNEPLQGQLKSGGMYTVVVYGSETDGGVAIDIAEDDLTAVSGAKVRFVNASNDSYHTSSETTDFFIGGVNVGTSAYHTATTITEFVEITGGTVTLDAMDLNGSMTDTDDELFLSASVDLPAGGVHTVVFMGDSDSESTDEQHQFKVFTH